MIRPPLLLMDEPLGALDRRLRERCSSEIAQLHRQLGITVIYVTHDQEEALCCPTGSRCSERGRIEQVGTADEPVRAAADRFVAGFVGDSNVFAGRSTGRDADAR